MRISDWSSDVCSSDLPEFSTPSWIAMLFAGGMGSGLLFWGVTEPVYHFEAPPGMAGGTAQAAREAMVITNLYLGLQAREISGICDLVIAHFHFRHIGREPRMDNGCQYWSFSEVS